MANCNTYIGSVEVPSLQVMIRTQRRYVPSQLLSETQLDWLNLRVPDWKHWRDDFRNQMHFYVDRELSGGVCMLASMMFLQSRPSHTPIDSTGFWVNVPGGDGWDGDD